jgi:hypothetical protein
VPGWFSKRPSSAPDAAQEDSPAPSESQAAAQPSPSGPSPLPEPSTFSPASAAEPMLTIADSRVKLSMNYVTCAAAILGMVALLALMYYVGRVSARPGAPLAGDGAGGSQTSGRPGGGVEANSAPPASERVKGKYYLIIDHMQAMTDKDFQDAEAVQEYCRKNNYPCDIVKLGTKCYAVWSLKAFDSPDSREAVDYAKAVEDLGKKYRPPSGRSAYTFSQHNRAGKLDHSFVRAKD